MTLPAELYKFSKLRENFFENRLVRITQRVELNDPYEFHPMKRDINEFRKHIPPKSVGIYNISDQFIVDNHLNCMGVMSFTESVDNFLMWSHYGDEHRGIAIQFDPQHEFFRALAPVTYDDKRQKTSSIYSGHINDDVFLRKSTQWASEKEWRIVDSLVNSDCLIKQETGEYKWNYKRVDLYPWEKPGLYMKQIPAEAILSVTFGCRVEDEKVRQITNIITAKPELQHLIRYRITLNYDEYKLELNRLNN
jgi:hypothetical protein